MFRPMYKPVLICAIAILFMVKNDLPAQEKPDLQKLMPKRFRLINKIEILGGANLNIPNDHGYGKFISSALPTQYPNQFTDVYKPKTGYFIGVGLIHSFGNINKFKLSIRVLWERKGYYEEQTDNIPNRMHLFKYDERMDFATVSLTPRIYIGKKKQWHFIVGASYSKRLKIHEIYSHYINGQLTEQVYSLYKQSAIQNYFIDAAAGIGYSFHLTSKYSIALQLTDSYGLTDLMNVNHLRLTYQTINLSLVFVYHRTYPFYKP